jgi:hypothetical protein
MATDKNETAPIIKDQKKDAETIINLVNSCWIEYDTRRSYEWKVSFGLWTAIGIMVGFSFKENFIFPFKTWEIITLLSIILFSYILFQLGLFQSSKWDQRKRHYYIKKCLHPLLDITLSDASEEEKRAFEKGPKTSSKYLLFNWSHLSQILITLAFLVILFISIDRKPSNTNNDRIYCQHCKIECKK